MPPTRRDLLKRTVAAVAGPSLAALPPTAGAAQTTSLRSVVDCTDDVSFALAGLKVTIGNHWAERWTHEQRAHFLAVIDREFPEVAAEVVAVCRGMTA